MLEIPTWWLCDLLNNQGLAYVIMKCQKSTNYGILIEIVWLVCVQWHIFIPALNRRAELWILVAISFSPWGPWYTAYMADMLANSAWAVQMLLVALSRLICCSLVCKARRYASWPLASLCINWIVNGDVKLRGELKMIFELLVTFLEGLRETMIISSAESVFRLKFESRPK